MKLVKQLAVEMDEIQENRCNICNKTFAQEKYRTKHMKIFHLKHNSIPIPCEICEQTFRNECYLKMHIKYVHTKTKSLKLKMLADASTQLWNVMK